MSTRLKALARKFRQQAAFAEGYSPLYQRLFSIVAGWLDGPQASEDSLVAWLLEAGVGRSSLEVSLLLPAGLHREMLAGSPVVDRLAAYFPTVGGEQPPDDMALEHVLREAIDSLQPRLGEFIQQAKVQTNETSRGLCWVLPLLSSNWPGVHLVDLGASAGLNLVADRRAYRLIEARSGRVLLDVGQARPVQFVTRCEISGASLAPFKDGRLPTILSRSGCDVAPFQLDTAADERTLKAFIWGDQVERLARLNEGLVAWRVAAQSSAPVRLHPVQLPEGLDDFLAQHTVMADERPVVIYNTYMTTYLGDKGESLRQRIADWAHSQRRPVLWLQWEPARDGRTPPAFGWSAWTADLWQAGVQRHWRLGWVHPHGAQTEFGGALAEWQAFWADRPVSG